MKFALKGNGCIVIKGRELKSEICLFVLIADDGFVDKKILTD